jgi:ELWxxDGT repeat protein
MRTPTCRPAPRRSRTSRTRHFLDALESRVLLSATDLGDVGQFASAFVPFHNALYFTAGDGTHGDQLWKTDGTPAGTVLVKNINPNPIGNATISSLTVLGDKLLFGADNGTDGPQIWVSDGTADGTVPLAGTSLTPAGFNSPLSLVNGNAYFVLPASGTYSIWKTDGTSAGTTPLVTLPTDAASYSHPFLIGSRMYLVGTAYSGGLPYNTLYSFNAADNSLTTVVPFAETRTISQLTDANGVAYFYTGDLAHPGLDLERYDPTNGRVHIKHTVANPATSTNVPGIVAVNDKVFFTADTDTGVSRVWFTEGSSPSAFFAWQGVGTRPINLTRVGDSVYYFAQFNNVFGLYVAATGGADAIQFASASVPPSSDLFNTALPYNGRLLFVGIGDDGTPALWISGGNDANTHILATLAGITPANPSHTFLYDIREMAVLNNKVILRSRPDSLRHHLYSFDLAPLAAQTPTGTVDAVNGKVISGTAADPNFPNDNVTIRVDVDGQTRNTIAASGGNPAGRRFTWTAPLLSEGNHTVDFYALNGFTGEAVKIGSQIVAGDGNLFDEAWYLAQNPDIANAVKNGILASGFAHFQASGETEGRAPSAFFNPRYYLSTNPDVAAALNAGKLTSAFQHFRVAGQFEKRNPSPFFDTAYYLAQNSDVAAAVNAGTLTAFQHFLYTGQFEKRNTTAYFDQASYLSANRDVRVAVTAGTLTSATGHFITTGQKENRVYVAASPFSETAYLSHNPDVAAAVAGGRFASGLEHFLWAGKAEGRSAT